MDVTPEALFFAFAALVQITLAGVLLSRRGRVEWMIVLGLLFAFNGVQSIGALLHDGFGVPLEGAREGFLNRLFFVVDFTTTALIAYLALAYPERPRFLRSRPWILPAAFGAFILGILAVHALVPMPTLFPECPLGSCPTWFSVLSYAGLPDLAYPLLLLRWTFVLTRGMSPPRRREFQWIFAAFAIRGAHVGTAFPLDYLASGFFETGAPLWFKLLFGPILLGSIAIVIGVTSYLLTIRRSLPTDAQRSAGIVLVFLVLGFAMTVVGGFIDLDPTVSETYFLDPLNSLDFLVVRPGLVIVAFLHTELFGPLTDPRRSASVATGALSFGVFAVTLHDRLPVVEAARWPLAALIGGTLAVMLGALAHGLTRSRDGSVEQRAIGRYVTLLEDTYRRGAPTREELSRLEAERLMLGISRAQATALARAVQDRWAGDPTGEWLPGDRILGRYTLDKLLGEGGMGQAWLARDELEGAEVVLKRTRSMDPAARRALLRESSALQRVRHPHIVRLLRTEVAGREPILVLEFAQGGSLAGALAERGGPAPRIERVAMEVLEGLEAAHAAGLVHGDLKPQNVLLAADGRALLSDFGLARAPLAGPALVDVTTAGPRGSLRYLAPEQVRGAGATPASDQYAAALVIAEAWQGAHPIPATLDDFHTREAILAGVRVGDAVPPGPKRVLERALATQPERRYPDVRTFRVALRDALEERPLGARILPRTPHE